MGGSDGSEREVLLCSEEQINKTSEREDEERGNRLGFQCCVSPLNSPRIEYNERAPASSTAAVSTVKHHIAAITLPPIESAAPCLALPPLSCTWAVVRLY